MIQITDVIDQFETPEAYSVYSSCMYMPTWEKFLERSSKLVCDPKVSILGAKVDAQIVGLIVIKINDDNSAEIKGIAVDPEYRKQKIGKQLIQYAINNLIFTELFAETDEDAVGFYESCGFQCNAFLVVDGSFVYKRFKCIQSKQQSLFE